MVDNSYLKDFVSLISKRYSVEEAGMTTGEWLCANTTLGGKPFNFNKFPFQKQICDDQHPNLDCMKISQVGLTEIQIRKAAAMVARTPYITALFTFPDRILQKKNSQTRIQPLIEENDVFNLSRTSDTIRSKDIIQIGKSYLMVTAATEGEATSTPCDIVLNDEVDLTDQKMLALFNSRMQNSDLRINQRFSTPTFPGYGVDTGFQLSDQHQYLIKCPHCNHWQHPIVDMRFIVIPNLPVVEKVEEITQVMLNNYNVDLNQAYVCCEACRKPLSLKDNPYREWVAKFPSRVNNRGYQISPFTTKHLDVRYVVEQLQKYRDRMFLRGWYNTVCGVPYAAGNTKIQPSEINLAFSKGTPLIQEIGKDYPVFFGADMGEICHIVLGVRKEGEFEVILAEQVHSSKYKERVAELDSRYFLVKGLNDRFPYTTTVNEVRESTDGRILPAEYRGRDTITYVEEEDMLGGRGKIISHVQTNRTTQLDTLVALFKSGTITISGYGTLQETISSHLQDMVRDEQPEKEAVWIKLTGNDHFFHAFANCYYALKYSDYTPNQEFKPLTLFAELVGLQKVNGLLGVK